MTKSKLYWAIPTIMPLLAGSVAFGQEDDKVGAADPIDEITVTSPPSLGALKRQMERAQEDTFSVFNAMNDDPNFHITCRMQRPNKDGFDPMPIHREVRVCATRYFRRESQRANEDYVHDIGRGQVIGGSAHNKKLTQKIHSLIEESQEFRQIMSEYVVAKREYDAAKEQE